MSDPLLIARNASAECFLLPQLANRHGLITGATGSGKTVTLQTMAQSLSRIGVPVFMADVKGDLTGLSQTGKLSDKMAAVLKERGLRCSHFCALSHHLMGRVWRTRPPGARHRQRHGTAAA
jgi:DNA helicase HerA-like ATPase